MVKEPKDQAKRFVGGLDIANQKLMINNHPTTHATTLSAPLSHEKLYRKEKALLVTYSRRAPVIPAVSEASAKTSSSRPAHSSTPGPVQMTFFKKQGSGSFLPMFCDHYHNAGHIKSECRRFLNQCLRCGNPGHRAFECPLSRTRSHVQLLSLQCLLISRVRCRDRLSRLSLPVRGVRPILCPLLRLRPSVMLSQVPGLLLSLK